jgi:hypothetical protein
MTSKLGFLSVAVVLVAIGACTVDVTDGGAGGAGGTSTTTTTNGGGSGGASTTSTAGGAAGTGGTTAGSAGNVSDAGGDAGCLDDPDAGEMANPDLCGTIDAYKGKTCMDAMGSFDPPGLTLCQAMQVDARPQSFKYIFDCIVAESKISTPCSVDANNNCVDKWAPACQVGPVVVADSGTSWDCSTLVADCPAYKREDCDFTMNIFTSTARSKIYGCYIAKSAARAMDSGAMASDAGASACVTDFGECVGDPAHMP